MKRDRKGASRCQPWSRLFLAFASVVFAACSVDTGDIRFIPDDQYAGLQAGSGGTPSSAGSPSAASGAAGMVNSGGTASDDSCPDKEGAARCSADGELELCKAGVYVVIEKCAQNRCSAPRKSCLDCAPGTFRCTKDTLEQCNLEGSAYELVRTCDSGQCHADGHVGFCQVCEPGEVVCEPSERELDTSVPDSSDRTRPRASLRICDDGSGTVALETCNYSHPVCDATEERCLVCNKGEVTCEGSVLSRCSEDGMALDVIADCGNPALCDAQRGKCIVTQCSRMRDDADSNALVECHGDDGTELSFCGPAGDWEVLALCDDRAACEAGTGPRLCRDSNESFCVPGNTSCEGNRLLRCADFADPSSFAPSGGSWYEYGTCAEGCEITGSGIAACMVSPGGATYSGEVACTPGDTEILDCADGECVESTCDDGKVCAGMELGCRTCVPYTLRCDDNVLVRCDGEGSREQVVEDCGSGYCDRFRGKCLLARPLEPFCDGKNLNRIGVDGTVQTLKMCGSEELCSPEAGCLKPMCVVGSKVCDEVQGRQVLNCGNGTTLTAAPTRCASSDRCEDGLGCVSAFRVAAGEAHTCAFVLSENGDYDAPGLVKCWGANDRGQLGNGAAILGDEAEARPVVFRERDERTFTVSPRFLSSGLCAGKNFTCADAMIKSEAAGQTKEEPGVVCWGNNDQGQLGIGTTLGPNPLEPINAVTLPVTKGIDESPRDGALDPFSGLHDVTCGADFACGLDANGAAWCWGGNDAGQLGIGQATTISWSSAQRVDGGKDDSKSIVFKSIIAGARHACALDEEDALWCWGSGVKGQLGNGTSMAFGVPQRLDDSSTSYALGRDFTLLQSAEDSKILAFGQNFFGQLGTGTSVSSDTSIVAASLDGDAVAFLFGGPTAAHACALISNSLECWGANSLGQLGDGTTEDRYAPVVALEAKRVPLFTGAGSGSVALGRSHTCAVDASGSLWCWGGNERKQLGASVTDPHGTSTPTEALTRIGQ